MRAIKAKLRSRRGASVTFALLLFTVCAVISAVVIVAASTAAGHMSGREDMDQRYNAVAAATICLCERLEGETKTVTVTDGTNLTDKDAVLADAVDQLYPELADEIEASDANGVYTCTITPQPIANGLLTFRIEASGGRSASSGSFTVDLVFASNVQQTGTPGQIKVSWKFSGLKKLTGADLAGEGE